MSNFTQTMRNEFKTKNFALQHDNIDDFFKSQWQSSDSSLLYLIYRWAFSLLWAAFLISSMIEQFYDGKYFIFLTNWGLIMGTLTQALAAILVTYWYYSPQSRPYRMTLTLKIYWVFYFITLSMALVITIIYWTFIYGNGKPVDNVAINFISHALNSVFMLADLLIVAFPLRLMHVCYVLLLPTIYIFFSYIYFLCDGTDEYGSPYIYPILDWSKLHIVWMTLLGTFALYLICAVAVFWIYKLRTWVHHLIFTHKEKS